MRKVGTVAAVTENMTFTLDTRVGMMLFHAIFTAFCFPVLTRVTYISLFFASSPFGFPFHYRAYQSTCLLRRRSKIMVLSVVCL